MKYSGQNLAYIKYSVTRAVIIIIALNVLPETFLFTQKVACLAPYPSSVPSFKKHSICRLCCPSYTYITIPGRASELMLEGGSAAKWLSSPLPQNARITATCAKKDLKGDQQGRHLKLNVPTEGRLGKSSATGEQFSGCRSLSGDVVLAVVLNHTSQPTASPAQAAVPSHPFLTNLFALFTRKVKTTSFSITKKEKD